MFVPKNRARIVNALINRHQTMDMACAPASWLGPLGSSGKCSSRRSSRGRCRHPTEKSAQVEPADSSHQGAGISTSRFHHPDSALFAQMLSFYVLYTAVAAERQDGSACGNEREVARTVCVCKQTHLLSNFDMVDASQRTN